MVIKPGKYTIQYIIISEILVCVGFLLFLLLFFLHSDFSIWLVIGYVIVCLISNVPYIIASTRTIVMDETGYTVCWGHYKKYYCWDELELKQYVHYKGVYLQAFPTNCFHAAEFFPKQVRIPKRMNGHLYSVLFHPFSFVFVCFPPSKTWHTDKPVSYHKEYPIPYEVDEEFFRAKLNEWGVEMVETKRGVFADDDNWHEFIK